MLIFLSFKSLHRKELFEKYENNDMGHFSRSCVCSLSFPCYPASQPHFALFLSMFLASLGTFGTSSVVWSPCPDGGLWDVLPLVITTVMCLSTCMAGSTEYCLWNNVSNGQQLLLLRDAWPLSFCSFLKIVSRCICLQIVQDAPEELKMTVPGILLLQISSTQEHSSPAALFSVCAKL